MKFFIIFTMLLLCFIGVSSFKEQSPVFKAGYSPVSQQVEKPFLVGAMFNGRDVNYTYSDFFKFNTWYYYTGMTSSGFQFGWPGIPSDTVFAHINHYGSQVRNRIDANYNAGMLTLSDRPKIQYIAFGQRSDYQCESENFMEQEVRERYGFYTYNYSDVGANYIDSSQHGSGARVRYCSPNNHSTDGGQTFMQMEPGYVVRGLKTNREQINRSWDWHYSIDDGNHAWYVKPRIRVDTAFANNLANLNTEVCKIEVLDFNGNIIHTTVLKVLNFKENAQSSYNGDYLENYFNLPQNDSNLIIPDGSLFNPDKKLLWDMDCQVDFRVWWYGQCDMWIDYVRVENELAVKLFRGDYDNTWLQWEVVDIANQHPGKLIDFYIEEYEFNMLPAIKYVNEKIISLSNGQLSLMTNLNRGLLEVHLPSGWKTGESRNPYEFDVSDAAFTDDLLIYYLYDYAGMRNYVPNFYPFEYIINQNTSEPWQRQYLPNTLWSGTPPSSFDTVAGILADITLPKIMKKSSMTNLTTGLRMRWSLPAI